MFNSLLIYNLSRNKRRLTTKSHIYALNNGSIFCKKTELLPDKTVLTRILNQDKSMAISDLILSLMLPICIHKYVNLDEFVLPFIGVSQGYKDVTE